MAVEWIERSCNLEVAPAVTALLMQGVPDSVRSWLHFWASVEPVLAALRQSRPLMLQMWCLQLWPDLLAADGIRLDLWANSF